LIQDGENGEDDGEDKVLV